MFDEVRDSLLVDFPWNFAIKRKELTPAAEQTLTSITFSGTTATATLASHGYSADMFVRIAGANQDEYNGTWLIATAAANTFTYTMDDTPTSNATGTLTVQRAPGFEYDYVYTVPSDSLRILDIYSPANLKFVVESNLLFCDEDEKIFLRYIKQVTDYTLWPSPAKKCLAIALALEMSPKIRGVADPVTRGRLMDEFDKEILRAYSLNSMEGDPNVPKDMKPVDSGEFSWQRAR